MDITLLQEHLYKALTRVSRVTPTRPQLPILQNIVLQATKEGLLITSTNMETTEIVWVGGKVEKEGELCVSARILLEFVASLPVETVRLQTKEDQLIVNCNGFQAELPTLSAKEYPPVPEIPTKKSGETDKETLCGALSSVLFAAATDEGRPVLTGVKVIGDGEKTTLASTDGYRLSLKKIELPVENLSEVVIPARALSEVVKLGAEMKDEKSILVRLAGEHQIGFTIGETSLLTRLLDGEFPNFERIIPKTFTTRARIEREGFLRAVRSAAIFARDNANIIRLELDNQKIRVSANAAQVGKNSIELMAKIDGDGGEIAFNSKFLLDFLTNYPEDEFIFEMTGALNSGVFKPAEDDSFLHIIMPVRVAA